MASGDGTPYAAFAGYTTALVSYTSVFNPVSPTVLHTMGGYGSPVSAILAALQCPGEMFGADAPGSTWRLTFDSANLDGSECLRDGPVRQRAVEQGQRPVVVPPPKRREAGKGGGTAAAGGTGGGAAAAAVAAAAAAGAAAGTPPLPTH